MSYPRHGLARAKVPVTSFVSDVQSLGALKGFDQVMRPVRSSSAFSLFGNDQFRLPAYQGSRSKPRGWKHGDDFEAENER